MTLLGIAFFLTGVEIFGKEMWECCLFFCYVTGGSILREWGVRSGGGDVCLFIEGERQRRERERGCDYFLERSLRYGNEIFLG